MLPKNCIHLLIICTSLLTNIIFVIGLDFVRAFDLHNVSCFQCNKKSISRDCYFIWKTEKS